TVSAIQRYARLLVVGLRQHVSPAFSACGVLAALTSGGNSELHRRSAQGPWALSCGQPRIGQALAADRFDHRIQPLKRVTLYVTFVQPEGELIDVSGKMFR